MKGRADQARRPRVCPARSPILGSRQRPARTPRGPHVAATSSSTEGITLAGTNRRSAPAAGRRSRTPRRRTSRRTGPEADGSSTTRAPASTACTAGCRRGASSSARSSASRFLGLGAVVAAYAFTEIPTASGRRRQGADVDRLLRAERRRHARRRHGHVRRRRSARSSSTTTLPNYVGQATAAAEDKSFFTSKSRRLDHGHGPRADQQPQGRQDARAARPSRSSTSSATTSATTTTDYVGKAKEALLAIKIARTQTKPEIMGRYLNSIYYGRDSYGIQAAAQAYFGVDASALTVEQAALLAGIIPSPNNWDPAVEPGQGRGPLEHRARLDGRQGLADGRRARRDDVPATIAVQARATRSAGTNGYLLHDGREGAAAELRKSPRTS